MPVQAWTVGQVLTAVEMKTITDLIPYYSSVSASTNPCVAGTFYDVDASGAAKTMSVPVTAGAIFGFRAKSVAGGVVTITTLSGVIFGPGCGATGSASITLGAQDAYVGLMADGTNLRIIAGNTDSGWVTPTLGNGYSAGAVAPAYRIIGNTGRLRGLLVAGGASANLAAWTLPAGSRPSTNHQYGAYLTVGTAVNGFQINTTGAVQGSNNSVTFNIDGMAFTID